MIRTTLISLAALPGLAFGEGWEVTTELVPLLEEPSAIAGDVIGLPFEVDREIWLNSEIVTRDNTEPLDCTVNTNLELNHFYGVAGTYAVDLFGNLARDADGVWSIDALEFYLDLEDPEASYLGADMTATLDTLDCRGTEALVEMTYTARFLPEEGEGPDEITMTGTARMLLPITRFSPI